MRKSKWVVVGVALGMMAATAVWLHQFRPKLGPAGVKVSDVPIYGESNNIAGAQSIVLPTEAAGIAALPARYSPITSAELLELPKDTIFGRRLYKSPQDNFMVQVSVVLMGTDHTSIHQPQYCLYAQNWNILQTDRVQLPMDAPFADIPAIKMIGRQLEKGQMVSCVYVYWFVSGEKITAEEGSRLWSMWKTLLQQGEMERWAYISYFAPCHPGEEQATFERLEKFIRASVPEFQLVKGNAPESVAPKK